jgi:hypothetical protein
VLLAWAGVVLGTGSLVCNYWFIYLAAQEAGGGLPMPGWAGTAWTQRRSCAPSGSAICPLICLPGWAGTAWTQRRSCAPWCTTATCRCCGGTCWQAPTRMPATTTTAPRCTSQPPSPTWQRCAACVPALFCMGPPVVPVDGPGAVPWGAVAFTIRMPCGLGITLPPAVHQTRTNPHTGNPGLL